MKRMDIGIDTIIVPDGPISENCIAGLMSSIQDLGLIQPVGLTADCRLIHGRHRLEACRRLGWETIPAIIHDLDDLHAEMAGIDENLMRRALSAAEEVQALARRKELYLLVHPETKKGGASGKKGGGKKAKSDKMASFAEDTASKTGKSKRSVQRDAALGAALPEEVLDLITGTPVANNKSELKKLAKLDADMRLIVAQMISDGDVDTVSEALRSSDEPDAAPEPSEILVQRLRPVIDRWMREFHSSPALAASVVQDFADTLLQEGV